MPRHRLKNFSDLSFLQKIDKPRFMAPLLRPHKDYFSRQALELARLVNSDACDKQAKGAKQPGRGQRDRLAYPRRAVERQVFKANHHHCVYCQRPVISGEMLKAFRTIVGPSIFGMGTSNAETHGLVFAHRAVADHLDPRSNGGRTDLENLVTACYACNFGKAQFTLAEIGLEQPRASIEAGWDGLESLRNELSARARADAKAR